MATIENIENKEERLTLPCRGTIIKLLIVGLVIFWLAMLAGKGNFGCSSEKTEEIQPKNQVVEYRPVKSEVIRQADDFWLIKWTGEGEQGFRLPDLAPGRYSLTWLRGKIVYSANGHSVPLWGDDIYLKRWNSYYYEVSGIRPHQKMVVKGEIGSGNEELIPFQPGRTQVVFRADGRPIFLFYHFKKGEYDQFGWDGSYAVFELRNID